MKYCIAAIALLLALLTGASMLYLNQRTKTGLALEAARTAQVSLKRTQATLAQRERQRVATAQAAASARASLSETLTRHRDWSDTPVPKEVQDDLCKTLHCADSTATGGMLPDAAASSSP